MQLAVFQALSGDFTPEQRLQRLASAIEHEPTDLLVCPELFLSGYNVRGQLEARAEAAGGPLAERVAELARAAGTAIVYGCPERDGKRLYNAASCIDRHGNRIAHRRKLMLPPGFEARLFSPGEEAIGVFDLDGVRCAILICYEVEFPETVRAVVEAGAEIVAVPTALATQWHSVAYRLIPTRAFENGVWLLYANHAGEENGLRYLGGSCIVAPDGTDVARAGGEERLISARFERSEIEAARTRLPYVEDLVNLRRKLAI